MLRTIATSSLNVGQKVALRALTSNPGVRSLTAERSLSTGAEKSDVRDQMVRNHIAGAGTTLLFGGGTGVLISQCHDVPALIQTSGCGFGIGLGLMTTACVQEWFMNHRELKNELYNRTTIEDQLQKQRDLKLNVQLGGSSLSLMAGSVTLFAGEALYELYEPTLMFASGCAIEGSLAVFTTFFLHTWYTETKQCRIKISELQTSTNSEPISRVIEA